MSHAWIRAHAGLAPIAISTSSRHFALRYEVPKFLPRGGHLCMAMLTICWVFFPRHQTPPILIVSAKHILAQKLAHQRIQTQSLHTLDFMQVNV